MLDLCMWSAYYADLSPEDAVRRFVRNGWRYIELSSGHAGQLLERGNPEASGVEFRRFTDDEGAVIQQGHLWLKSDIAAINQDEVIDILKCWLDLFQGIGIRHAVLHTGGLEMIKAGCEPERIHEARVRALQILTDYIKNNEMLICLENTVMQTHDMQGIIHIIESVNSPKLGICLDTGHLNRSGDPQRESILLAKPYLKALHINDNLGDADLHLMPYGIGTVNWQEVVSTLKEIGYKGLFNLELKGEAKCPAAIRDVKLEYLKKVLTMMLNETID